MSRLVLLNLSDSQVDVLSRIEPAKPKSDVLVFHENPDALVIRLARLAEWTTSGTLPEPRSDDTVVTSDPESPLVGSWRRLGAAVTTPDGYETGNGSAPSAPAPAPAPSAAPSPPPVAVAPQVLPVATPAPAPVAAPAPALRPPVDALTSPESSFAYLAEQTLGAGAAASLWWDGDRGSWAPCMWTGNAPASGGAPQGPVIETEWGKFSIGDSGSAAWNAAALRRVAEDYALRDLMRWQRTAADLAGIPRPSPGDAVSHSGWLQRAADYLGVDALFLWEGDGSGWLLRGVFGEGFSIQGELRFPDAVLTASFESEGCGWYAWAPRDGFRAHLRPGADPRWTLRLDRFRQATEDR